MNVWKEFNKNRISPEEFVAFIEIEAGSKNKYELDKETGLIILDRVLFTSTHYPLNYGFIPLTYAEDKDPLDVLVICFEPIQPLCLVNCYPIGVMEMIDSEDRDEKILAICSNDPSLNCFKDVSELPSHILDEIKHFFKVYKQLEGKTTYVSEIKGAEEAKICIEKALKSYEETFGGK